MTDAYSKTRLTEFGIEIGERYSDAYDYLDENRQVAYQDDSMIIYIDPTGHAYDDWANTIGVSRDILFRIMHEIAYNVMSDAHRIFANVDPLVIRKP
jgi:phosphate uptake regulator